MTPQPCPHCGGRLNVPRALDGSGTGPRDGDWGCCLHCSGLLVFEVSAWVAPPLGSWMVFEEDDPDLAAELLRFRAEIRRRRGLPGE